MTISYNLGVPFSTHNPSTDQPDMLLNTGVLNDIWNVDHYGFNEASSTPGGQHKYLRFPAIPPLPPASTGVVSTAFVNNLAGQADATKPQLYYANSNGTVLLSGVKAFGYFTITPGFVTLQNGVNLTIAYNSVGQYTATVAAGALAVASAKYTVLVSFDVSPSFSMSMIYSTITGDNTFLINAWSLPGGILTQFNPTAISVQVLQF